MFGQNSIRHLISQIDLRVELATKRLEERLSVVEKEVELLRANQYSDVHHWWNQEHGVYIMRGDSLVNAWRRHLDLPLEWKYRSPSTLEWKEIGPDLTDAIADIEAEEAE